MWRSFKVKEPTKEEDKQPSNSPVVIAGVLLVIAILIFGIMEYA